MIEFFSNIGKAIMENKDNIILFFTSGQFALLLGQIAILVKTIRSNKNRTQATKSLQESVSGVASVKSTIESTSETAENIEKKQDAFKKSLEERDAVTTERLANLTSKVDAIIEVQSIVYSTIKDEKVRNTVSNILVNAKYSETQTRAELQRQVEELKAQVSKKVQSITDTVERATTSVSAVLNGEVINRSSEDSEEPMRY